MKLPLPVRLCASSLPLLLLTQCGTPKVFEGSASEAPKIPVWDKAGHLFRATAVSMARAPVSTTKATALVIGQRTHALITGAVPLPRMPTIPSPAPVPGSEGFETLLDTLKLPARMAGKVHLLVNGREFFPELHRAYREAQQSIDTQVFIFDNDDCGVECADILREKSRDVPVRVFMDSMGTRVAHRVAPQTPPPPGFKAPAFIGDYLCRKSGVRVRTTTNPALLCDHTKLHIIDGKTAYVGGMNIGREYESEWHDLMARIEGPVVHDLGNIFNEHWNHENWVKNWTLQNWFRSKDTAPPVADVPGQYPLRVLRTSLQGSRHEIVNAFRAGVEAARRRVWVHTPYLAEEGMIQEFSDAAARGVDVRVIIPGQGDSGVMQSVNENNASRLKQAGVKVYRYPGMTHMKVVLCDDWAMFGSANCDTLSLKLNCELNLASSAPAFVKGIEQRIFLTDFPHSPRFRKKASEVQSGATTLLGNQL